MIFILCHENFGESVSNNLDVFGFTFSFLVLTKRLFSYTAGSTPPRLLIPSSRNGIIARQTDVFQRALRDEKRY